MCVSLHVCVSLCMCVYVCACVCVDLFRLTRQALPLAGLQQDGPLPVQRPGLAALTQVRLWDVLPVDAHAVDVLPCTGAGREERAVRLIQGQPLHRRTNANY